MRAWRILWWMKLENTCGDRRRPDPRQCGDALQESVDEVGLLLAFGVFIERQRHAHRKDVVGVEADGRVSEIEIRARKERGRADE